MDKVILKKYGDVRRLAHEFKVSEPTVRAALSGKTKSILAHRIREKIISDYKRKIVNV